MSIKPIYTEHEGWTGLKFERDGEAELAARVTTTDRLKRMVVAMLDSGEIGHVWLDTIDLLALHNALGYYWSVLGEEAKLAQSATGAPQPPASTTAQA